MLISELERTTELRGLGAGAPEPIDWEAELERVRVELDEEQSRFPVETRRHEERVYDLLRRKADALAALAKRGTQ